MVSVAKDIVARVMSRASQQNPKALTSTQRNRHLVAAQPDRNAQPGHFVLSLLLRERGSQFCEYKISLPLKVSFFFISKCIGFVKLYIEPHIASQPKNTNTCRSILIFYEY